MFDQIIVGILLAMSWEALALVALGVFVGITVGAIPGLGSTTATAILVPLSFFMPPTLGIPFLLGLHKGGLFGGSIPAVLVNTPGTASAAATTLDGYPLAQKGEAKSAIQMALYSSTIGDTFSDIVLIVAALPLAAIALLFGPAEFFSLMVVGLTIIATVTGGSPEKGIISALIGLMIGFVGEDIVSGAERFTFGIDHLVEGVLLIPMMIGLFAVSEMLIQVEKKISALSQRGISSELGRGQNLSKKEMVRNLPTIFRSSCIGTFVGAIPGTGAAIATFISYAFAQKRSKRPEEFGKGSYEGVAASEAANSAVAGADLIPTLAFGIPGSGTAAILMGAFLAQGLRPGPSLFQENAPTMYAIFTLLLLGNPIMLLEGWFLTGLFARLVTIRQSILIPLVLIFCMVGTYAFRGNVDDVITLVIFGAFGYALRKMRYPMPPLVIGFILTPTAEESFKQALLLSHGDYLTFLTKPISALFLVLSVMMLFRAAWKPVGPSRPSAEEKQ